MTARSANTGLLTALGVLSIASGLVLALILVLQPWMSCEGEDSSPGCPVPAEAVPWMYAAWAGVLVSLVVGIGIVSLVRARR